jgi:hypothetical protein
MNKHRPHHLRWTGAAMAVALAFFCSAAFAQQEAKDEEFPYKESTDYDHDGDVDEGDLAKAAQNPVGDLISLPFQNNMNFDVGPADRTQDVLNIQPVLPITLSKKWNLITRTILPVISQPAPGTDRTNGIGDLNFTGFISPKKPGKVIWGAGPALIFPTATDDVLGTDKFSIGPSFVALTMKGQWVIGALASNVWSVAGDDDRADVNFFLMQYFINYNFPSGWYLTSAPIITANWEADSGNKWTVPFGGGVGKVFSIGSQPMNVNTQVFYNVEAPTNGARWQWRFQIQLLFPK